MKNSSTHFTSCHISTPNKTLKQVQGDVLRSECDKPKLSQPVIASVSEAIRKRESPIQTKKAFTLAEIMIVLMIIGILTAILLPSSKTMTPNEKIMKFKKGNEAMHKIFSELINSDEYYLDGDLGVKPDGTILDGTHEGDRLYLCQTIANLIKAKKVNCQEYGVTHAHIAGSFRIDEAASNMSDVTCIWTQNNHSESKSGQILTQDNIIIYEANAMIPFGWFMNGIRIFAEKNSKGHLYQYKPICLDIDGWKKGEDPFAYGVQVDGRIQTSLRAREWLAKTLQEKD